MMAIMLATIMLPVQASAVRPGFPGCPPDAVSSLCAPPPPPPPHKWDDKNLERVWLEASAEFLTLSRDVTPQRFPRP